jgi:hypothetical protein
VLKGWTLRAALIRRGYLAFRHNSITCLDLVLLNRNMDWSLTMLAVSGVENGMVDGVQSDF